MSPFAAYAARVVATLLALLSLLAPRAAGALFLIELPHVQNQLLLTFVDPQTCPVGEPGLPPRPVGPGGVAPSHAPIGPSSVAVSVVANAGAVVAQCLLHRNTWLIEFTPPIDGPPLEAKARDLASHPLVKRVSANSLIFLQQGTTPNDAHWTSQWALQKIDVVGAWQVTHGSKQIRVAVIDSGIDVGHEDLAGNAWVNECEEGQKSGNQVDDPCAGSSVGNGFPDDLHGWNFSGGNAVVGDDFGHGTQVAGVIGAVADNQLGIAGVSPEVSLIAVKIADSSGISDLRKAINGIDYARSVQAHVINASWNVEGGSEDLEEAIERARVDGIVFVTGAGNTSPNGRNIDVHKVYPASFKLENILVVAATNAADARLESSNFGPGTVDVGAPGDAVLSCSPPVKGAPYAPASYTSIATPHVTGVVALIRARCPDEPFAQIRKRVQDGDAMVDTTQTISGMRLNARKALEPACGGSELGGMFAELEEWWDSLAECLVGLIRKLLNWL